MVKFLIIGPVTRDTILKTDSTCQGIGGPVYYQAGVLSALNVDLTAIITLGMKDYDLMKYFPSDIELLPVWGDETMQFENIYPDENPNHRVQRACIPDSPIKASHLWKINLESFDAVLVSPLSPYDVPYETLKYISQQGVSVYLGVQGYLRHFEGHKVVLKHWGDYKKFLRYVDALFMDEVEAGVITGDPSLSLEEISQNISHLGPDEVIITRGSRGSVIYSESLDNTYRINAVPSKEIVDPTGLGDSYLAAYAFKRQETSDPYECGIFASVVASLKLERKGAFHGNKQQIKNRRLKII